MTTATIVNAWSENGVAKMAIAVTEVGGRVEYVGEVPITDEFTVLTPAAKKAALVAACKAKRDAQVTGKADFSMTGSVTV